jgi:hypothetical protein
MGKTVESAASELNLALAFEADRRIRACRAQTIVARGSKSVTARPDSWAPSHLLPFRVFSACFSFTK